MASGRFGSWGGGHEPKKDGARHGQAGRADGDGRLQHGPDVWDRDVIGNIAIVGSIERTKTETADYTDQ